MTLLHFARLHRQHHTTVNRNMVTLVMHMHLIKISVLFYVLNLELAQDLIRSFRA